MIVYRWFKEYDVDAHIDEIRKIYRKKINLMCEKLDEYCPQIEYVRPQGGLFLWAKLPENVDMLDYCKRLVERKVAVVPGNAFIVDESKPCNYILPLIFPLRVTKISLRVLRLWAKFLKNINRKEIILCQKK